jgi:transaldolase
MKIFLASTKMDDITWATSTGLADAVYTTPALLSDVTVDGDGRDFIAEVCRATSVPVAVSVTHVKAEEVYRDGRELARISDQVLVQVPFVEDAIPAISRLASDGVRVAATLVFNAAQAVLASKVGATAVVTSLSQLDAQGDDATAVVSGMRAALDVHDCECDVIATFARNAAHFTGCALAGADAIALDTPTLHALLVHPLTDRGLDQLLGDLSRRPKPRAVP